MKKSTVLFDLGNTLISYYKSSEFTPVLKNCIDDCCTYLSSRGAEVDFAQVFEKAQALNREREDLVVWKIEDRLSDLFGTVSDDNQLCRTFMQPIFDTARLDPEAVPLLSGLRDKGYKVGIVSNTPWGSPSELWREELGRHGLMDLADVVVFCVDVGWRKPHKAIFEHALNRLGSQPHEAVFVGDDKKWDIYGAEQAGITPILMAPEEPDPGSNCVTIKSLSELYKHV